MRVRVRVAEAGEVSVELVDPAGAPVLSVGSLVSRPISVEQLTGGPDSHCDALFGVDWTSLPEVSGQQVPVTVISGVPDLTTVANTVGAIPEWLVLSPDAGPAPMSDPDRARIVVNRVLEVIQAPEVGDGIEHTIAKGQCPHVG